MEPKALAPAKINPTKLLGGSSFVIKKINTTNNIGAQKGDLVVIKTQVIEVKNLIKSSTLLKQVEMTKKRKQEEKDKFSKKEAELETKKEQPGIEKVKVPGVPKLGFLERIKNIIFAVLLGRFVVKMLPNLPKLLGVVKAVGTGIEFAADFSVGLINSLATFIQKADEASKQTRGFLKTMGGDSTAKLFDNFNGAIGKVIEAGIIATIALSQIPREQTDAGGGVKQSAKGSFGKGVGRRLGIRLVGKDATKQILRFIKPLAGRAPLIGGLLEFGISWILGDSLSKAAFRGIGATLLGAVGTAVGGPLGLAIGGLAGGEIGGVLYDLFFSNKKPSPTKVQGRAQGGVITRGGKFTGGPAKRGVSKTKKRGVTAQPTKLKPGADIGGQKNVEKVFPSPQGKDKNKQVNPLGYIKKSNEKIKNAPFFGALLSLRDKALVGQKPTPLDYSIAAQGLNAWMNMTFSSGVLRGGAFASGGEVNADMFLGREDLTQVISKSLQDNISKQLEGSIQDLMKQMMLKSPEPEKPSGPGTGPGPEDAGGEGMELSGNLASKSVQLSKRLQQMFGLKDFQAAAIVGTWLREGFGSGFPDIKEGGKRGAPTYNAPSTGGYGFAQWTNTEGGGPNDRLNRALIFLGMKDNPRPWTVDDNLKVFKWEIEQKGYGAAIRELKKTTNLTDAVRTFVGIYEAGGMANISRYEGQEGGGFIDRRLSSARGVLKYMTSGKDDQGKPLETAVSSMGSGDGKWRFGLTGRTYMREPGWSHAHFEAFSGGINTLVSDTVPLLKKMSAMGLKPELSDGTPILSGKSNDYYERLVRYGKSLHTHSGIKNAVDVNMPGFPVVPFGLKNFIFQPGGAGNYATVPGSGNTVLMHMSRNQNGLFRGGLTGKGGLTLTHPGEYIIDKDSVDAFGINFFDIINQTESVVQRKNSAKQLMSILQFYAGYEAGGRQRIKVKVPAPQVSYVPVPVPVGGGMMPGGSSTVDSDYDSTYMGH